MNDLANPARAAVVSRFFKTAPGQYGAGDYFLGIAVLVFRKLAVKYQEASPRVLTRLLDSRWHEERLLALLILVRQYSRADPARREAIYRLYMNHTARINNWDLRDDPHDLIHKAVGWMLREAGKRRRDVEEAFLQQHAKRMPRTMLRYAIEHFPERLRQRYLRMRSG